MKRRRLLLLSVLVVALLFGGCGLWVWQTKRQDALNRQLIDALMQHDYKKSLVLVEAGADPNIRCNLTPIPSLPELLRRFLRHKSTPVEDSRTAFMFACGANWIDIRGRSFVWTGRDDSLLLVCAMLRHGADVNATTANRQTALIEAVLGCHDGTLISLLLDQGANANTSDTTGATPLMWAAYGRSQEITGILLAHGANIHAQDNNGDTALHYAVDRNRNKSLIKQLLAQGASPNQRDNFGVTPLLLAQRDHRLDIVALLHTDGK